MSTKCKLKIIDGAKHYIKERGETSSWMKVMSWMNSCVTHIQNSCSNGIAEIKIYHTAIRTQVNYIDPIGDCKRHIKYFKKWTLSMNKNFLLQQHAQLLQVWDASQDFQYSINNS
jgi:hypothetical protein